MNENASTTRVIILASTLVTGGAETVVRAIAAGLPDRGIEPTIVCLRAPGAVGERIAAAGTQVVWGLRDRGGSIGAVARLAALMRRGAGTALLCLDHHDAIAIGMTAARIAGIRGRALAVHSTGLWGRSGSFSRSDRLFLGGFTRIIAVADAHREYLRDREGVHEDRIAVIHNGVDVERFRPADGDTRSRARRALDLDQEAFVAVIVAALRPEKNHAMLMRAAARLRRVEARFVLLIVGEGSEAEALRGQARTLGLGDAVRFLGRREDIPAVFAAADLSILCSHPVVETFPLSVLESMACAVPVVATSVGSIPEMIEDGVNGILVRAGDEDALADSVAGLMRDQTRRHELGERARVLVETRYTERAMIDSYARLLRGLVQSKGESRDTAC